MSDRPLNELLLVAIEAGMPGLRELQKRMQQQEGISPGDFWLGWRSVLIGLIAIETNKGNEVDDLKSLLSQIENALIIENNYPLGN
jgi:hypothetical protein